MNDKMKKKNFPWPLVIFVFIIIVIFWQFFLKIFPQSKKEEDDFIKDLVNQGVFIKDNFDKLLSNLKEIKFTNSLLEREENKLTNKEIERLKEKVLQYTNQKLMTNNQPLE
ncbi:MAG: hypothetical protein N2259_03110 [Patescibacteria group bacterium]|nr:hypothetical protein [Patescibacteria group bacterium]